MPVPNTFANATATIPLSQLDANFATTITLGNTAIQLGNTVSTLNNMTLANVTVTSGNVTITNVTVTTANVTTANIATAQIANVTVSGTGTFAAGSNTAPSITTSGDTNTGIFFPAADTIAFTEGGVESMRITSAGDVGIGTSTPATISNRTVLSINNASNGGALNLLVNGTETLRLLTDNSSFGYVYNIANQPLLFGTNNTERGRFSTAGNLLLGVTSDSGLTAGGDFALKNGASIRFRNAADSAYLNMINVDSSNNLNFGVGGVPVAITFGISGVGEAARFTSGGNFGIGITADNPLSNGGTYRNVLAGNGAGYAAFSGVSTATATGSTIAAFSGGTTGASGGKLAASINIELDGTSTTNATGRIAFYTCTGGNAIERARITSGGNLLLGSTVGGADERFWVETTNADWCIQTNNTGSGTFYHIGLRANGTQVGTITSTSTTTTYGTSSDYRLKDDVQPMTGALAKVAALKPVTYKWKADGSDGEGFIAHELAEICPYAVVGEKDAVDEEGNIEPQNIDTSFLVATLTAAIQEQQAMIDELKAKVAALENP